MKIFIISLLIVCSLGQTTNQQSKTPTQTYKTISQNQQQQTKVPGSQTIQIQLQHPKQGSDVQIEGPKIDIGALQSKPIPPVNPAINKNNPFYHQYKQKNSSSSNNNNEKEQLNKQNVSKGQLKQNSHFGNYFSAKRKNLRQNNQKSLDGDGQSSRFNFIFFYGLIISILFGFGWLIKRCCCASKKKPLKHQNKKNKKQIQQNKYVYAQGCIRQDDQLQQIPSNVCFEKTKGTHRSQYEISSFAEK